MKYRQITSEERYTFSALRKERLPIAKIARILGRHRSTIYPEVQAPENGATDLLKLIAWHEDEGEGPGAIVTTWMTTSNWSVSYFENTGIAVFFSGWRYFGITLKRWRC
ncbi:helix-turn-helix domain-containing protein [Aestuariirhabdus haliotis]|uniref:helix-turn-helix domain-containing protein n=1 Tax=Aestuariirhabdus haliotis TaxID=2918751 RepID=UPI003872EC2A